jgi:hypothetical protein
MVYKANTGWAFRHDCSENRHCVEGPFKSEEEATTALNAHTDKCNG